MHFRKNDNVRRLRLRAQRLDRQREQADQRRAGGAGALRPASPGATRRDPLRAATKPRAAGPGCRAGAAPRSLDRAHLVPARDAAPAGGGGSGLAAGAVWPGVCRQEPAAARAARPRRRDLYARSAAMFATILAERGPLTRAALFEQLATHDIRLERPGQAAPARACSARRPALLWARPGRRADLCDTERLAEAGAIQPL